MWEAAESKFLLKKSIGLWRWWIAVFSVLTDEATSAHRTSRQPQPVTRRCGNHPDVPFWNSRGRGWLVSQIVLLRLLFVSLVRGAMGKELGARLVCWGYGFRTNYEGIKTMRREGRTGGEWEEDDRNSATRNAVNQYSTKMFRWWKGCCFGVDIWKNPSSLCEL